MRNWECHPQTWHARRVPHNRITADRALVGQPSRLPGGWGRVRRRCPASPSATPGQAPCGGGAIFDIVGFKTVVPPTRARANNVKGGSSREQREESRVTENSGGSSREERRESQTRDMHLYCLDLHGAWPRCGAAVSAALVLLWAPPCGRDARTTRSPTLSPASPSAPPLSPGNQELCTWSNR